MHAAGRRCPGRAAASRPRRSRRWSRAPGSPRSPFVTKGAAASFTEGRTLPPYFRERADWQFVSAVLEATWGTKKFALVGTQSLCRSNVAYPLTNLRAHAGRHNHGS